MVNKHLFFFSLCCLLASCSGGSGGGSPSAKAIRQISGAVQLARVREAKVEAFVLYPTGDTGRSLATTSTDSDGNYSLELPDTCSWIVLKTSGGHYQDEATSERVVAPELSNVIDCRATSSAPLTIMTSLVKEKMTEEMRGKRIGTMGNGFGEMREEVKLTVSRSFGLDKEDIDVIPAPPGQFSGKDIREVRASLVLSALSHLAKDKVDSNELTLPGQSEPEKLGGAVTELIHELKTDIKSNGAITGADWAKKMEVATDAAIENPTLGFQSWLGSSQPGKPSGLKHVRGILKSFDPENNSPLPVITIKTQPQDVTANELGQAEFSVDASVTGGYGLTYQWQKQEGGQGEFTNIGQTSNTKKLNLTGLNYTDDHGDIYRVLVSADGQSIEISQVAVLNLIPPVITVSLQPEDTLANSGGAQFTIQAIVSQGGSVTYQWQKQEKGVGEFMDLGLPSAQGTLSLSGLSYLSNHGDKYRVKVQAAEAEMVMSQIATLTMPAPLITINSILSTATTTSVTAGVSAIVTEGVTLSYQWEKKESGSTTFSSFGSSTSSNQLVLTGLSAASDNGDVYRVTVSAPGAISKSDSFTVSLASACSICGIGLPVPGPVIATPSSPGLFIPLPSPSISPSGMPFPGVRIR